MFGLPEKIVVMIANEVTPTYSTRAATVNWIYSLVVILPVFSHIHRYSHINIGEESEPSATAKRNLAPAISVPVTF